MKIGIDIDEVITSSLSEMILFHNKKYNTNLKRDDFHSYDFWKVWGGTKEEAVRKVNELFIDTECLKSLIPFNGVFDILKKLKNNYYELHIITGRRNDMIKLTEEWINKHFPNIFSSINFTNAYCLNGNSENKSDICKKLGIQVMIEDDVNHALDCSNNNIKTLLLDCPWNKSLKSKNLERVFSWEEIYKKLQ